MVETLCEPVAALSLDSSNFPRNMRTINRQIKEAESTFRLAGAGVESYEKTITGTESKLSHAGIKLTRQRAAIKLAMERALPKRNPPDFEILKYTLPSCPVLRINSCPA